MELLTQLYQEMVVTVEAVEHLLLLVAVAVVVLLAQMA